MFSAWFAGTRRVPLVAALACGVLIPRAETQTYRGRAAEQWIADLASGDLDQRWYAAHGLAQIGPGAAAAVGPLLAILADRAEFEYVRAAAAFALGRIGADPDRVVPLLAETLSSDLASVRRNSARALGRFGREAQPAVERMIDALDREDAVFRVELAEALWHVARHPRALPLLAEQVRREAGPAALEAAEALGRLAERSPEAIAPLLVQALDSENGDLARSAAQALGRAGRGVLPHVAAALQSGQPAARRRAAEALVWMGQPGTAGLIAALSDPAAAVRRTAARGLGRLGRAAREAEPALLRAASDPDPTVRGAAAAALRQISSG
ncbi:MAG: HEAT repeat domain-containing protein [Pirellulales bacterium]|jgi:HEAT repeat protein|nr:HEAT repeat domain-containing protein [Thermoguttaceae bacterium]MDD4789703.1 HEAT repeat domain-containing protein [Pirellulales bacterium]MDI9444527.1 HEAT repeat domain-containing protein [Planctomycetota bacterium]NLZ00414.1 HEAT repeat domain-containing protein [Pirellulaceae bacterium]